MSLSAAEAGTSAGAEAVFAASADMLYGSQKRCYNGYRRPVVFKIRVDGQGQFLEDQGRI